MRRLNPLPRHRLLAALLAGTCLGASAGILPQKGGELSAIAPGDNAEQSGPGRYVYHGLDGKLKLVSDPLGSGRKVLEVTLTNNGAKAQRTELTPYDEYIRAGKRWYAFSVRFPTSWAAQWDLNVFQLHTSQSISGWDVSPPLAVLAVGGNLVLRTNGSHLRPTLANKTAPSNAANNLEQQNILLEKLNLGNWYCGVIMVDWNINPGQGATSFWLNNKLVYSSNNVANNYESEHDPQVYKNAAGNSIEAGNYPKAGLYAPGYMDQSEVKVHHGFVWVGTNQNADNTVTSDTDMQRLMAQKTMCPM